MSNAPKSIINCLQTVSLFLRARAVARNTIPITVKNDIHYKEEGKE